MPPGLDGWMRTMGAQLSAALHGAEVEKDEVWVDGEEPDDTELETVPESVEEPNVQAAGAPVEPRGPCSDTPWGSHGFEHEADYEVWRKMRVATITRQSS